MQQTLLIPVGEPGLTAADFGFRFYENAVAVPAVAAALTVSGDDVYSVAGLPAPSSVWRTVTWEYPPGAGSGFSYQLHAGAPQYVVVPLREGGLTLGDVELFLYLDGAQQSVSFNWLELGSPGDYRVGGWPLDQAGKWLLIWRRAGVAGYQEWSVVAGTGVTAVRFLSIEAKQEPFPIGLDALKRPMMSVNFDVLMAAPAGDWEMCIVKLLVDAELGSFNADIFRGSGVALPEADGPYISIINTGGTAPMREHGNDVKYLRPSFQLVVTAKNSSAGRARARAAYDALDGSYNLTVAA